MIKLIENFFIKVDADQYILIRHKSGKTKTGEPTITTTVYGYFGTIEACIEACQRALLSERVKDKILTLSEAIEMIKDLKEEMQKSIWEKGVK